MYQPKTAAKTLTAYDEYLSSSQRQTIQAATAQLSDAHIAHINSTASGGGVAEMLASLVPLSNDAGVETDWLVMEAPEAFFDVTKTIHNGLQGEEVTLTDEMRDLYRDVTAEAGTAVDVSYDALVLHDPQTLGLVPILAERMPETPLIWRCHIDLTDATDDLLDFVRSFLAPIDRAIFTLPEYGDRLAAVDRTTIHPAIDPLTPKNQPLNALSGEAAAAASLDSYPIDPDRPLLVQVSRFDPWKDPLGVVATYRRVRDAVPDAQLALVGSRPDDDPEGIEVYREVAAETNDDPGIHLLTDVPDAGVNALQRHADVVLQKSLREGFALTVAEALWKETPVVGANVGGIPLQIDDGVSGYLVDPRDIPTTAARTTELVLETELNQQFGRAGREQVRKKFLLPRLAVDYLELLADVTAAD